MADNSRDIEPNEKFCSSCGAIISEEATFCPECGQEQSYPGSESSKDVFSIIPFNKIESATVVCSILVFLGAFLSWGGNPVASVTGLETGLGYITIILSIATISISYYSSSDSKRMFSIFLIGVLLLCIVVYFLDILAQTGNTSSGGGLLLTILGGVGILVLGLSGYASYTSIQRAVKSVGALILLLGIVGASISVISQYNERQEDREQLDAIEGLCLIA
jgi:hypothetical protein